MFRLVLTFTALHTLKEKLEVLEQKIAKLQEKVCNIPLLNFA